MYSHKKQLGAQAEELVYQQLKSQDYLIEQRNWNGEIGEIDIIAVKEPFLVIVEVRSVSASFLPHPFLNIPRKKQIQVSRCALEYLKERKKLLLEKNINQPHLVLEQINKSQHIRFDVAGVKWTDKNKQTADIFYLENAFYSQFAF
jgi:putative endonuclease